MAHTESLRRLNGSPRSAGHIREVSSWVTWLLTKPHESSGGALRVCGGVGVGVPIDMIVVGMASQLDGAQGMTGSRVATRWSRIPIWLAALKGIT